MFVQPFININMVMLIKVCLVKPYIKWRLFLTFKNFFSNLGLKQSTMIYSIFRLLFGGEPSNNLQDLISCWYSQIYTYHWPMMVSILGYEYCSFLPSKWYIALCFSFFGMTQMILVFFVFFMIHPCKHILHFLAQFYFKGHTSHRTHNC